MRSSGAVYPYQDLVWSVFLILENLILITVNVNFNFHQLQFAWPLQYSTPVAWPWGLSSSQAPAEHDALKLVLLLIFGLHHLGA